MVGSRRRRPSLLRTAARTAVITGTASSVANSAASKQQAAAAQQAKIAAAEEITRQAAIDEAVARAVDAQQPGPPATQAAPQVAPQTESAADDPLARLERLAALHQQGMLTAEEFSAAKALLLGLA